MCQTTANDTSGLRRFPPLLRLAPSGFRAHHSLAVTGFAARLKLSPYRPDIGADYPRTFPKGILTGLRPFAFFALSYWSLHPSGRLIRILLSLAGRYCPSGLAARRGVTTLAALSTFRALGAINVGTWA